MATKDPQGPIRLVVDLYHRSRHFAPAALLCHKTSSHLHKLQNTHPGSHFIPTHDPGVCALVAAR